MELTAENIEDLVNQIFNQIPTEDDDDTDGDELPEPPVAETLEEAAIRVSTALLQDVMEGYETIRAAMRTAELNTLYALHLSQQIHDAKHQVRIDTCRTIREQLVFFGEAVDMSLYELTMAVKEAVRTPEEPKLDA